MPRPMRRCASPCAVTQARGQVSDAEIGAAARCRLRPMPTSSRSCVHVALNTLTNYVNEVAGTEVDFPRRDRPRRLMPWRGSAAALHRVGDRIMTTLPATSPSPRREGHPDPHGVARGLCPHGTARWLADRGHARPRRLHRGSSPASTSPPPAPRASPISSTAAARRASCACSTSRRSPSPTCGQPAIHQPGEPVGEPAAQIFLMDYANRQPREDLGRGAGGRGRPGAARDAVPRGLQGAPRTGDHLPDHGLGCELPAAHSRSASRRRMSPPPWRARMRGSRNWRRNLNAKAVRGSELPRTPSFFWPLVPAGMWG